MHTNTFNYTKQESQNYPNALNSPSNHSTQVHPQGSPTSGDLGGLVVHNFKLFDEMRENNQIQDKRHSLKGWRPNDASEHAPRRVAFLVVFSPKCRARGVEYVVSCSPRRSLPGIVFLNRLLASIRKMVKNGSKKLGLPL